MFEKSSINFINGDKKKNSILGKLIYSFFFICEIILETKCNKDYSFKINQSDLYKFWGGESFKSKKSPIRTSCDAYLINFLRENFPQKKITIFDLGCGEGNYSTMIKNLGYDVNYLGIDCVVSNNWQKLEKKNINFIENTFGVNDTSKFTLIKSKIKDVDLILSQSCLEHIKYDITALKEIILLFPKAQHLHFVPSSNSFFNYFLHGYRRYTFHKLKNLGKKLNKRVDIRPLGNHYSLKKFFSWYYLLNKKKHNYDYFNYFKKKSLDTDDYDKIVFSKKINIQFSIV